jgi:hypothetical protein
LAVRIRYCPSCHEEYRPDIVSCADCGALLEDRDDEASSQTAAEQAPAAPSERDIPEGYEPVHTTRELGALPPLADALVAAGIDCRVRDAQSGPYVVYRLLVHGEKRAAAAALIEASLHPHVDAEFDPERGYARCPACDTPLSPGAVECSECGLPLAATEVTCPDCGATAEANATRCPACGCALDESS